MIDIHRVSDFQTGVTEAANALANALTRYRSDAILLLFSGGSPLEIVKILPSKNIDSRISFGVSDERFSEDPAVNNFAQLNTFQWSTLVVSQGATAIDTRPLAGETLEEAGMRFDLALKQWRHVNPDGKIIITQGIGLDGHTAGMMPFPEDVGFFNQTFVDTTNWAVGYDAKEKNKYPLRVTTTVPFLSLVDLSIVFACGNDKQKPVEAVFASKEDSAMVPGRILHQMKDVQFYTDCNW